MVAYKAGFSWLLCFVGGNSRQRTGRCTTYQSLPPPELPAPSSPLSPSPPASFCSAIVYNSCGWSFCSCLKVPFFHHTLALKGGNVLTAASPATPKTSFAAFSSVFQRRLHQISSCALNAGDSNDCTFDCSSGAASEHT